MAMTTYEQLRLCHVKRWHIVQTHRTQTVAEHAYAVSVIAGSLAAAMRWKGLLHHSNQLKLLQWSLSHDILEAKTGDMPTPFKRALEAVGGAGIVEKAEDFVDRETAGGYRAIAGTEIEMIVKLADQMEAIFFLQDNGYGQHAIEVLDGLRHILGEMVEKYSVQYPEIAIREGVREVCAQINIHGGWL